MSHLAIILLIVGAFAFILGTVKAVRAYLENRSEELAPFRNYFGPSTSATCSGKAPGATMETYMRVALALKFSTPVIGQPSSGIQVAGELPGCIQVAAEQSEGIASGIDPGLVWELSAKQRRMTFSRVSGRRMLMSQFPSAAVQSERIGADSEAFSYSKTTEENVCFT